MSDTYYRIEREYEAKFVGVKDASAQAELVRKSFVDKTKYDQYIEYFLSYQGEWFYNQTKFPSVDFDFEYVKLKKSAILTDFLYFGPSFYHRYLISEKVRGILKNFNISSFKYYNTKIYTKKESTEEYKFFYCPSLNYDFVDFIASSFSVGYNQTGKKYVEVNSEEEFKAIKRPINREKIVLKNIDPTLDYFNVLISPDPFISERLRNEFVAQKVTGIRMIELTENQFEILS